MSFSSAVIHTSEDVFLAEPDSDPEVGLLRELLPAHVGALRRVRLLLLDIALTSALPRCAAFSKICRSSTWSPSGLLGLTLIAGQMRAEEHLLLV